MHNANILLTALVTVGCMNSEPFVIEDDEVQRFVEARCASVEECCDGVTTPECERTEAESLAGLEAAVESTLFFSEGCYDETLQQATALACHDEADPCRLAHGVGRHGDDCRVAGAAFYYVDSCEEGLQCRAGRCVDDPFLAPKNLKRGDACSPFELCEPGLFCSDDGVCAETRALGESCTQLRECEGGNRVFCEMASGESGVCTLGRERDEACESGHECGVECDDNDSCKKLSCTDKRCGDEPPLVCTFVE